MSDQQQALYTAAEPTWKGPAAQQTLANRVFKAMVFQGALFPENFPIRQTLENLAVYIASQDGNEPDAALYKAIETALKANSHVFRRTTADDSVIFATTRMGVYTEPHIDTLHSFEKRLYEPEHPLPLDDLDVVITRSRPALTTIEPVYISDYWQQRAPTVPDEQLAAPVAPPPPAPVTPPAPVAPVAVDVAVDVAPVAPRAPEPVLAPRPTPAPAAAAVTISSSTMITLDAGNLVDLSQGVDSIMAGSGGAISEMIRHAITSDPLRRIVSFGDEYYPEDAVVSLSKGDLRRIREYILEQGEPMPDTSILGDVYYKNPREHDYATFRFALNYRLNREKDFEFVGVPGSRLWSAKGLPTIGTKRLKTSELGQFYSFLEENPQHDDSLAGMSAAEVQTARQLSRFLTFFEWEYGVLPYDAAMKALLPQPLLPDQRTAILRIEIPQQYTVYLAELRYPTSNRGGWLHGLEDFFREHLVPGAMMTLAATDDPSIWTLQYGETPGTDARLLQQDDKKARFAFASKTYYCDADDNLLATQERLPRLKNMKLLPAGERRRITSTAGYVLEQVGQSRPGTDNGFELSWDDLFIGVNVQRPATRAFMRTALAEDENFLVEDSSVLYFPPPEEQTVPDEISSEDDE